MDDLADRFYSNLNFFSNEKEFEILNNSILTEIDVHDFEYYTNLEKYLNNTYTRYQRYLQKYNIPSNMVIHIETFMKDYRINIAEDEYLYLHSKYIDNQLFTTLIKNNIIFFDRY